MYSYAMFADARNVLEHRSLLSVSAGIVRHFELGLLDTSAVPVNVQSCRGVYLQNYIFQ